MPNEDYQAEQEQQAQQSADFQNQQNQQYQQALEEDARQQELARRIAAKKKEVAAKAQGPLAEAQELAAKLKKVKTVYRAINITTGITLFGLVITWLVMTWQFIISGVEGIAMLPGIGKNFGVKFVPALSIAEFIILLSLWLLVIIGAGIIGIIVIYADA